MMKSKTLLGYGPRMPLRTIAMDSALAGLAPRRPAAAASAPAKKPMTLPQSSASPKPSAPKKPAADGPTKETALTTILDFLVDHLDDETFLAVEQQLKRSFVESGGGSGVGAGTTNRAAADRRRVAADSAGMGGFFDRFPSARKIGAV